jgi:dihydrofolate reductase
MAIRAVWGQGQATEIVGTVLVDGGPAEPLSRLARAAVIASVKASVFIGTSVDGFIARPNGGLDWLPSDGGEEHGYEAFIASVDALVIGRNTYEIVLAFDSWPYGTKPVFVLSSRPLAPAPAGAVVEQLSGDPAEIVARLAKRGYQHVYVDGGITIQRFLRAGLIQRLIITRVPVLIGEGIPLFGPLERDVVLEHVATRHYASGLVQSEYVVAG